RQDNALVLDRRARGGDWLLGREHLGIFTLGQAWVAETAFVRPLSANTGRSAPAPKSLRSSHSWTRPDKLSPEDLVGAQQDFLRNLDAKVPCGAHAYDQFVFRKLLDGQISRVGTS